MMNRCATARHPCQLLLCTLLGLLCATGGTADEPSTVAPTAGVEPSIAVQDPSPGAGVAPGSLIFIDPVSGELTAEPTAEQEAWWRQRALQRGKQQAHPADQPARPFALRGGGEGVFLGDSVLSTTVIRRRADGSWSSTCASGEHSLDAAHAHHGAAALPNGADPTGDEVSTAPASAPVM